MGGEVMMVETSHGLQQEEQIWMTRIRLRSQRRILWMRDRSLSFAESGYTHDLNGFADSSVITDREVDRILAAPQVLATAEANFYDRDEIAQSLTRQIQMADDLFARDPVWQRLQQVFRLSALERDLLSLTIALEVDPFLRRVYGYLHDDATMTYPTLWLASMLFQWSSAASLEPDSGLVRWRLAYPVGNEQARSITSAWVVDPAIASWSIRGDCTDPALGEAVSWLPASLGANINLSLSPYVEGN
ncbi:MAG: hypothetical protein HC849_11220 [Oscillatoriales cyanobacterium RU_3_3]|nr:hypothetical protein [Oscillatoriales cyanobacterium RU_3_3]